MSAGRRRSTPGLILISDQVTGDPPVAAHELSTLECENFRHLIAHEIKNPRVGWRWHVQYRCVTAQQDATARIGLFVLLIKPFANTLVNRPIGLFAVYCRDRHPSVKPFEPAEDFADQRDSWCRDDDIANVTAESRWQGPGLACPGHRHYEKHHKNVDIGASTPRRDLA